MHSQSIKRVTCGHMLTESHKTRGVVDAHRNKSSGCRSIRRHEDAFYTRVGRNRTTRSVAPRRVRRETGCMYAEEENLASRVILTCLPPPSSSHPITYPDIRDGVDLVTITARPHIAAMAHCLRDTPRQTMTDLSLVAQDSGIVRVMIPRRACSPAHPRTEARSKAVFASPETREQ